MISMSTYYRIVAWWREPDPPNKVPRRRTLFSALYKSDDEDAKLEARKELERRLAHEIFASQDRTTIEEIEWPQIPDCEALNH